MPHPVEKSTNHQTSNRERKRLPGIVDLRVPPLDDRRVGGKEVIADRARERERELEVAFREVVEEDSADAALTSVGMLQQNNSLQWEVATKQLTSMRMLQQNNSLQ